MRSRRRPLSLLIIGVISLLTLASLIYFFPPNSSLTLDKFTQISPLILFFVLVTIVLFSIGSYLLNSKKKGILIAGFVIIFLLFRLTHLTHPFFLILLLALFFSLEMFVSSRGNK